MNKIKMLVFSILFTVLYSAQAQAANYYSLTGDKNFVLNAFDKYFKDADMIIHARDVLYHGPRNPMLSDYNPAKLAEKLNACSMPVVICRGNCDSEVDTLVLDMPIQAPYTYVVAEGLKIVTTHGHYVETDEAKDKMAKALKADRKKRKYSIFKSGFSIT